MRTRMTVLALALVAAPATSRAQQSSQGSEIPPTITVSSKAPGEVTLGIRATDVTGDEARYQRYRDLRDGPILDRLRWRRQTANAIVTLGADHVGYRDQRFFATIDTGRLRVTGLWDQIPLFFSGDTRSLYTRTGPGTLEIDDSIQTAAQANYVNIRKHLGQASGFDTRYRRDTVEFGLGYSATKELELKLKVRSAHKEGTMPFGASFGLNNSVELAVPIDHRTTDVTTVAEWASPAGSFRVGYFGSWFDNRVPTLVWDNPLAISDSTDTTTTALYSGRGVSRGRMPLWPSGTLHTVDLGGGYRLPGRTRVSGNLAIASGSQDATLVPHTTNPLIAAPRLDRETAEAEVRTTNANVNVTTRPHSRVSVTARYRLHDYDNRTPVFHRTDTVRFDQVFRRAAGESEYFSRKSQRFDADAGFNVLPSTAFRLGYGYNHVDRTARLFERTTENVFRASVDSTGNEYLSVRAVYERAGRAGEHLEPHTLQAVGEQPGMRHYDVANRDRSRATALLMLNPVPQVAITAAVGRGKDDYEDSAFGLRDSENATYSVGVAVAAAEKVDFSMNYGSEKYTATQSSRNAVPGPQFTDPNRDFAVDGDDDVDTFDASLSLQKAVARTDIAIGYTWSRSKATYIYRLATPFQPVQQLPVVKNELAGANVDVRYQLSRRMAVGIGYRYERYRVDDFALGPQTIQDIVLPVAPDAPAGTFLGYVYRPYTAHTAFLRLSTSF